jgi:hypothetical protein
MPSTRRSVTTPRSSARELGRWDGDLHPHHRARRRRPEGAWARRNKAPRRRLQLRSKIHPRRNGLRHPRRDTKRGRLPSRGNGAHRLQDTRLLRLRPRGHHFRRWPPWVLDVKTIPGFTETSTFPPAAGASGISFEKLVESILDAALHTEATAKLSIGTPASQACRHGAFCALSAGQQGSRRRESRQAELLTC